MCMDKHCFPDCWKASLMFHVIKNVEERSTPKNYHSVSLLSKASQIFDKTVNNNLVDHHEKVSIFPDLQHGFRLSHLTADLLTVASGRILKV